MQQRKLNAFEREYNFDRPHAALELETLGSVHVISRRQYYDKVDEGVYPPHFQARRVCKNSALRWRSTKWVMISTSLCEKNVGLEEIGEQLWRVYFRHKMLGYLEEETLRIQDELGRLERKYVSTKS